MKKIAAIVEAYRVEIPAYWQDLFYGGGPTYKVGYASHPTSPAWASISTKRSSQATLRPIPASSFVCRTGPLQITEPAFETPQRTCIMM
jgi:hypothetical protein